MQKTIRNKLFVQGSALNSHNFYRALRYNCMHTISHMQYQYFQPQHVPLVPVISFGHQHQIMICTTHTTQLFVQPPRYILLFSQRLSSWPLVECCFKHFNILNFPGQFIFLVNRA